MFLVPSIVIAVSLVYSGCVGSDEPLYAVRRSALVPHPQPPMQTGHAPDDDLRLTVYDSTVLVPVRPVETAGANAGLYVARHNLGGDLAIAVSPRTELLLGGEASLLRGAMAISRDAPPPPLDTSAVFTMRAGMAHAVQLSDDVQLGLHLSLGSSTIPYNEEGRCLMNCGASTYYATSGTHEVMDWSASLLPNYRVGRLTMFGGLTLTNHPTNSKYDTVRETQLAYEDDAQTRTGPTYAIAGAGAEWAASRTVHFLAQVFEPLSTSVAAYAPAFAVALSVGADATERKP